MNRLLIASYNYPPTSDVGSLRTVKLAKYLVRLGWAVRVVSVSNPDVWRIQGDLEEPEGVGVRRVRDLLRLDIPLSVLKCILPPDAHASGTRGLIVPEFQVGWLPAAALAMRHEAKAWGATHLLGTGPPFSSLVAAAWAAERTHLPFVADLQDSWTLHPDTEYPSPLQAKVDRELERYVFERASAITTVTNSIVLKYAHVQPEFRWKFRLLPNGFDPEDFPPADAGGATRDGRAFRVVYTGSFYPHTPPDTLLSAAEHLDNGTELHFYGRPDEVRDALRRHPQAHGVTVHGFVTLKEAVRAASEADLLYFLLPKHFGEALSDKLFTYLATENPILAEVPEGEAKAFLTKWGRRVFFVEPNDPFSMEAAVRTAMNLRHVRDVCETSRERFRETYSRETQARELDALLRSM